MEKAQKITHLALPALLCAALWGSASTAIKIGYRFFEITAGDSFSQLVFAGWRFFLAGLVTLLAAKAAGRKDLLPNRGNIKAILCISLFQCMIQYVCYYIGMAHVTGTKGALLTGTQTFFAIIFAHLFLKDDKITPYKALGCVLGFGGVVVLNLGGDMGRVSFVGDGLVLLSAVSAAMGSLVSRVLANGRDPMMLTGWQLTFGGLFLLILGLLGGGSIGKVTLPGILLLGYMVLLSAVAFSVWTWLLKHWPVGKVALYNFMIPVFGALIAAIFLGERSWSVYKWGALALVSAGIICANLHPELKKKRA